jgi:hypothetical protein
VLCAWRQGQPGRAESQLERALQTLETAPLTSNNFFEGYTAVITVLLEMWEQARSGRLREFLAAKIERALRVLRRFASLFRVVRPWPLRFTGQWRFLRGDREGAASELRRALGAATALGLSYEAALAQAWLGRATRGPEHQALIELSRAQLVELGAPISAEQIRRWS